MARYRDDDDMHILIGLPAGQAFDQQDEEAYGRAAPVLAPSRTYSRPVDTETRLDPRLL
jgi:hypothetical protein